MSEITHPALLWGPSLSLLETQFLSVRGGVRASSVIMKSLRTFVWSSNTLPPSPRRSTWRAWPGWRRWRSWTRTCVTAAWRSSGCTRTPRTSMWCPSCTAWRTTSHTRRSSGARVKVDTNRCLNVLIFDLDMYSSWNVTLGSDGGSSQWRYLAISNA